MLELWLKPLALPCSPTNKMLGLLPDQQTLQRELALSKQ